MSSQAPAAKLLAQLGGGKFLLEVCFDVGANAATSAAVGKGRLLLEAVHQGLGALMFRKSALHQRSLRAAAVG